MRALKARRLSRAGGACEAECEAQSSPFLFVASVSSAKKTELICTVQTTITIVATTPARSSTRWSDFVLYYK